MNSSRCSFRSLWKTPYKKTATQKQVNWIVIDSCVSPRRLATIISSFLILYRTNDGQPFSSESKSFGTKYLRLSSLSRFYIQTEMNELAHSSKELIIEDDMAELSTSDGKQTHLCDMLHTNGNAHDEHAASIVWWTNVFCVPFIACVGLACNAFNLLILTTNSSAKRIPSVDLLLALALFDSLFLIFGTIELTPPSIYWLISSPFFNYLYIHSVLYMRTLSSTFYKTSVLVVVAFNVERYICVCHPLHSNRLWTTRTSRTAIVICLTASFLSSLQWPICYRIQECKDHSLMRNFYIIALSENINLQLYYQFMDFLSLITFNMLPIVALLSLNTRLIITLRKVMGRDAARTIKSSSLNRCSLSAQRFNANAILFAVVVLLLVCVGPQAPARLLFDYYGQYHETAIVYICVTQQLVFLNASLNFCLYCLVSRRYRSMLQQTIKRLFGNAWK
ncbi:unnamed protein product [Toxocara canis]|uniref:G_PROTEIN_RECEP_F1_2 domain-containing protein n=2 Tax=Toxocara canis TaxID=6265 RepID=A0A183UQJ5_TOXCA|nr:unnamed protein product [Toxocara canis]